MNRYRMTERRQYKCLWLLTIAFILLPALPTIAQRQAKTINDGWSFVREDVEQACEISYDDSKWQKVSIPHSWNGDAYVTKNYYRGTAWYRKSLTLSQSEEDRQQYLRFEGVNQVTSVYINGHFVVEHKGGYTSFTFDITPYCLFGKENIIAVKADNSLTDVPPVSGDFTFFGGIYRDVWLISTPKRHIDLSNYGSNGIFIDTDNVSEKSASYTIRGSIVNEASTKATIKITHTLKDPQSAVISKLEQKISLKANEKFDFNQSGELTNPLLWTPESPYIYTIETTISDVKTNKVLDTVTSTTGFRWYKFDGEKGFFLNGKPYKLNGVCRHQDQMPIANALTDEMHRRDMQLIKEMGANFIRISHYPQDNAIIEQCDKLGLLVWEEIPIIDIVPDEPKYGNNCETNLREMIRQHYNHPSVIMWGYMNEILLVTQRKNEEEKNLATERALKLAKQLEVVLKEEDKQRCSVMAFHGSESYNKLGFADIVDIVGWNLYQGWYSDNVNQFDRFMEKQQKEYPNKPKIVSEYGAGSDKRIHSFKGKRFDFSMEYQQEYAEHYLSVIEREPYIVGATYWNFIDFGSAQRDESMPRINNKGLVYSDRTPKDVYYLFKAYYRKDIPVLHIASQDWKHRVDVKTGDNPIVHPIKVYSNCSEVELFLNGKSLGIKKCEGYKAVWDVPFTDGVQYISAKGVYNGKTIETGLDITLKSVPDVLNNENFGNKELAINVGSNTFYTAPESNLSWLPDREYIDGSWGYMGGKEESTQTQIIGTSDNPLFQTLRTSPEAYRFDVPTGEYEIELLFADIFHTSASIAHNLGSENKSSNMDNKFDIIINDNVVEESVDLKNTVGHFYAIKKRYIVKVENDKYIIVKLEAKSGKTFLNGIKIRKL